MVTGLPLITAVGMTWLPPVVATTRVLPEEDGRGVWSGRRMTRVLFSMVADMVLVLLGLLLD